MSFGMRGHDLGGKQNFDDFLAKVKQNNIDLVQLAFKKSISDIDFTLGNYNPGLGYYIGKRLRDNNIHVAAFDSANGDLKYVFIDDFKYTVTTSESGDRTIAFDKVVCTVDSYQTVGKELTIDVAEDANGYQIPHIGYWGNTPKRPRYAYLADPTNFYCCLLHS